MKERAIIIGGNSGIGAGIAKACRERGMEVVVASRRSGVDATDEEAMARLFAAPVHHVVLTAVDASYQKVREMDLSVARRAIDSKIVAALLAAKHARFSPSSEGGGSLTFVAGIAMDRPGPNASIVAAMNGAVTAMARALAVELAPVRVNTISPGWVDTPVWDQLAGAEKGPRLAAQAAKLPVRRIGAPADIASAALFLMTNGFVTGECLHIDGGHRLA